MKPNGLKHYFNLNNTLLLDSKYRECHYTINNIVAYLLIF